MLPGLWPAILHGGLDPFRNGYAQIGVWSGAAGNYSAGCNVEFEGGTAPFTYAWTIDNGLDATFDNPNIKSPTAHSAYNAVAGVNCTITDARGQTLQLGGTIQEI